MICSFFGRCRFIGEAFLCQVFLNRCFWRSNFVVKGIKEYQLKVSKEGWNICIHYSIFSIVTYFINRCRHNEFKSVQVLSFLKLILSFSVCLNFFHCSFYVYYYVVFRILVLLFFWLISNAWRTLIVVSLFFISWIQMTFF